MITSKKISSGCLRVQAVLTPPFKNDMVIMKYIQFCDWEDDGQDGESDEKCGMDRTMIKIITLKLIPQERHH